LPDIALNPRHSVYETLARPLKFYFDLSPDQIKVRVFELLDQMELAPDIAQRLPGALSGGQKQRLCIARALAAKPDLIICDEITSALDQLVAEEILKLLQRLRIEFGLAYLFITHDLGLVARIANKVAVLQKGRMVAQGPLAETLVYGRDPYIDRLLTCVPQMRTDWLDEIEAKRRISTTA
jgi:peptide/nickel transport system ATP-binding protein